MNRSCRIVDDQAIPACTFTDPEGVRMGLNEREARERNIPYEGC